MLKTNELQNLRVATLCLLQELEWDCNTVPWLSNFLSDLPYPEKLEELTVPTLFQGNTTTENVLRDAGWPNVQDLICSRFPNLKFIRIKCFCGNTLLAGSLDIPAFLRSCLPALADRDILIFDIYSRTCCKLSSQKSENLNYFQKICIPITWRVVGLIKSACWT